MLTDWICDMPEQDSISESQNFSKNQTEFKNKLDKSVAQLSVAQRKVYDEWLRRSSRYEGNIWIYVGCDKSKTTCKFGISVREPHIRLWDIGYRCVWGCQLPGITARRIEAYITAKYRLANGNGIPTGRDGYRETYPYRYINELTELVRDLVPENSIIRYARTNI